MDTSFVNSMAFYLALPNESKVYLVIGHQTPKLMTDEVAIKGFLPPLVSNQDHIKFGKN